MLAGCRYVEPSSYNQQLAHWIGVPENQLYAHWGQPDSQFSPVPGTYVLTYLKSGTYPKFHDYQPYRADLNYGALAGPKYGDSQIQKIYYCKTTFTIRNGIVVNYAFNGDDCI